MQFLNVEGHKIAALPLNPGADGPPIILLHGVTLAPATWSTESVFTKFGPCYALSLPGHTPGAYPSDFPETEFTAEMIPRVLAGAIKQLVGDTPVILAGHSTGGFAALAIAAQYPQMARGVVSLAGFAQGRWIGPYGLFQTLARSGPVGTWMFHQGYRSTAGIWALFRWAWGWHVADRRTIYAYPKWEKLLRESYRYASQPDLYAITQYFKRMPDIDITPWLANIQAPVLAVAGTKDPTVPPSQAAHIAEHCPHGEAAHMEGIGHMIFMENPALYDEILSGWFEKIGVQGVK